MPDMQLDYEDRLVAFIDILGFKEIIKQSERNNEKIQLLYQTLQFLKKRESPDKWNLKFIEIEEDAQKRGLKSFEIENLTMCNCFSDSIVVSVKSNFNNINELASTLIANLAYIGAHLITEGILIRGGITYGKLIHLDNGIILGQALIDAYQLETNSAKYPRILLSNQLIQKLNYPISSKRDRYPYHQYIFRFEDGCVGFHQMIYFQVLQNSDFLDSIKLKAELDKVRKTIIDGLDSNFEQSDVHLKYQWLKQEYDKLIIFESEKKKIYELNEGISGNNIHYTYTNNLYDNMINKKPSH